MFQSKTIQDLLYSIIFLLILYLVFSFMMALVIKFIGANPTDLSLVIHIFSFLSMFLTGLFIAYRSRRWYLVFGTAFLYFSLVTAFYMWMVHGLPDGDYYFQLITQVVVMIVGAVFITVYKNRKPNGEASYDV